MPCSKRHVLRQEARQDSVGRALAAVCAPCKPRPLCLPPLFVQHDPGSALAPLSPSPHCPALSTLLSIARAPSFTSPLLQVSDSAPNCFFFNSAKGC
eukprot:3793208-Pleurochrysis_carterae.AAC.1